MQEAADMRPGSMAAIIGLDEETTEEVCQETGAEVANINGADQIVISGGKLCVARAVDLALIRGARKAVPLAVGGAFHSSLMSPAQRGLAAAIDQVEFRDPVVPIIANSTSTTLTSAREVKDELCGQLCSCVQWKKSVNSMMDHGVTSFIEFGPGKVLGSLIKRIGSNQTHRGRPVEVLNVADLSSAQKAAEFRAGVGLKGSLAPAF